jgi:hypothetical protein
VSKWEVLAGGDGDERGRFRRIRSIAVARNVVVLAILLASATATKYELLDYNPIAAFDATRTYGSARFTVLTDRLIRMEYSESKKFEDRSTLAFVNRALPVPKFMEKNDGTTATIDTGKVILTYKIGQPFSATSLVVTHTKDNSPFWKYGDANTGNLLGTIKSLDELGVTSLNCTENAGIIVHGEALHCQWALVSRAGWAVVDDSQNQALDEEDWWAGNNTDTIDSYLFAHGHDYMGALNDYVKVGGKTAMVPRQASGIWWTRWFDLNNRDVIKVVDDYKSRQVCFRLILVAVGKSALGSRVHYTVHNTDILNMQAAPARYLRARHGLAQEERLVRLHIRQGAVPVPTGV